MSEYIRRTDAIRAVLHNEGAAAVAAIQGIKAFNPHDIMREMLIDAQIDAVPVRHGEWSNRRTWTHDGEWYCTACDKEITMYMGEKRGNDRYKYCPNCGAKMDGKENAWGK